MNKHNWVAGESLQWSKLGLPYEMAQTPFQCTKCGAKFIHYYHTQPNIYKAMKKQNIPEECLNTVQKEVDACAAAMPGWPLD